MGYVVDYSGDHAHAEGRVSATYVDPDGNTDTGVQVLKEKLTVADIQGTTFGIAPGDVPFTVWVATLDTATLKINGRLTAEGVSYTVIGILGEIPDDSQTRIACRRER